MEEKQFAPVAITPCSDYSPQACSRAIEEIAAKFPVLQQISAGTKVAIKVNLITVMKPEKAATTHPALLSALVEYLCARGAEVVIGDSPGGPYNKAYLETVYRTAGMTDATAAGATLNQDFAIKTAEFPEAKAAKEFEYTAYLDKADLIINFCKLKTHGMMTMSCAVKNMFGTVPGLAKPAYHYQYPSYPAFANMLIDLNEYFHPALNIVDAVVGMEGNGPTAGTPRKIGAVLASESPYTLDLVCAKLIGLTISDVPTLQAAYERGLAPENADTVTLIGNAEPYVIPDYQTAVSELEMERFVNINNKLGDSLNGVARNILAIRPVLNSSKCIGCRKCAALCPAHAIEIKNKKPKIDRDTCIRCFCCQEFCPEGALVARRSKLGDMILKKRK